MQCYGFSALHYVSLQKTCTTSYALGNKCTKINQRRILLKNDRKSFMKLIVHTKFGVIWTYHMLIDNVTLRTRNAFKKTKDFNSKNGTRFSYGSCALPSQSLQEICIPSLKSFEPIVTKLCSGQDMLYKK